MAQSSSQVPVAVRSMEWHRNGMHAWALREGGHEHARLRFSAWACTATLEGQGILLAVRGFWRPRLVVTAGAATLATGRIRNAACEVLLRGIPYELRRPSAWSSRTELHGPTGLMAQLHRRRVAVHQDSEDLPLLLAAARLWDRYLEGVAVAAITPTFVIAAT